MKKADSDSTFTFIIEYDGGTYISQWIAASPKKALSKWMRLFDFSVIPRVRASWLDAFRKDMISEHPTRISGTKGVWCAGGILGNKLMIINVVRTSITKP
jgi:hypothetical protein